MTARTTRISPWLIAAGLLAAAGFGAHIMVLAKGQALFGSSDTVPWNILVAAYGFLAGTAAGISFFASLGDAVGVDSLRRVAGPATAAALATLVPALVAIFSDLGRPAALFGFLTSPNPSSPLWWMAITYGAVLLLRVYKLRGLASGRPGSPKGLSYASLALAVVAPGVLGTLFASLAARPLWYGAGTTLFVVVLALAIGAAATLVTAVASGVRESRPFLIRAVVGLTILLAVVTFARVVTAEAAHTALYLTGEYAALFWGGQVIVGLALPLLVFATPFGTSAPGALTGAGAALTGGFAAWLVQVLAGQALPVMPELKRTAYSVTGTEILMVAGIFALALLLFVLLTRFVPGERGAAFGDD